MLRSLLRSSISPRSSSNTLARSISTHRFVPTQFPTSTHKTALIRRSSTIAQPQQANMQDQPMTSNDVENESVPELKEGQTTYGNYELVTSFTPPSSTIPIQKWRSTKTGLSFVWAGVEGPIVNGTFTVPTEIFDDTGRPHTLEHLVFLGSELYPFKGILDNLANRAFADGTNAWTDTDNTSYTISTAGGAGFLKLLPVYLDHILYPTLTPEGFTTEVHHIDAKAEDAGVVYAEMQARENGAGDLMALKLQRLTYPQTSAYRSETGGLLSALRTISISQIQSYHASSYIPSNLTLLITGSSCPLPSLLHTLQTVVEPRILAKQNQEGGKGGVPEGWKRPFVESASREKVGWEGGDRREVVEFMEKDESVGEVQIAFGGEGVRRDDFVGVMAIDVLTTYLTDSAVAPLTKEFVEIAEPYCTSLDIYTSTRVTSNELTLYLSDVPSAHLDSIDGLIKASLKRLAEEEGGIDMERMGMVLRREKRQSLHTLESRPDGLISQTVVADTLYGTTDGKDLEESFKIMEHYAELEKWSQSQWRDFLKTHFVSAPTITVIGKPSAALAKSIVSAEKKRIAAQKESLGEEGLKKKVEELKAAQAFNEREIPREVLEGFKVPSVDSVKWVHVETATNDPAGSSKNGSKNEIQAHVDSDGAPLPYYVHYSDIKSNFLTLDVFLSAASLPPRLRPYASLWQDSFFSLPIRRADGQELSHEEVINQLNDQTVEYYANYGSGGAFEELLRIQIKVEKNQYETTIAWLRDLIFGSVFSKDRLEVTVAKLVQELPQQKRDGDSVSRALSDDLLFDESKSTAASNGLLRSLEWLPEIAKKLKEGGEDEVRKDMEAFRDIITKPENLRISVAGDILSLPSPRSAWRENFQSLPPTALAPVPWSKDALSPLGQKPAKTCVTVSLASIEGSYSIHTAKGVSGGWLDPDLPALEVSRSLLNGLESYLWKFIRGSGLAYGAGTTVSLESGTLGFYIYKAPDAGAAFLEGKRVIEGLADESIELETALIDAAKSSLVFAYARKEKTNSAAANLAFGNEALKGLPLSYGKELLAKIQNVTKPEILASLRTYFLPLFSPATSVVSVASAPGKIESIEQKFAQAGYTIERRTLPGVVGGDDESGSESGSGSEGSESGSGSEESGSEDGSESGSERSEK